MRWLLRRNETDGFDFVPCEARLALGWRAVARTSSEANSSVSCRLSGAPDSRSARRSCVTSANMSVGAGISGSSYGAPLPAETVAGLSLAQVTRIDDFHRPRSRTVFSSSAGTSSFFVAAFSCGNCGTSVAVSMARPTRQPRPRSRSDCLPFSGGVDAGAAKRMTGKVSFQAMTTVIDQPLRLLQATT